jgi:cystathionine gamma-synthase
VTPDDALHPDTLAVVAGRGTDNPGDPVNVPVYFSSTYHAGGPVTYARESNPTWTAFEETLGALEGGTALAFASGMAAITTLFELLPVAAAVVAPRDAYTGTRWYLNDAAKRGRLDVRLVDITDTEAVATAAAGAALVWLESPTNPLLGIADIPAVVEAAHMAGAIVVVDNTFATPLLQRPLDLGADVVAHSATKFIAGHSDVLMGALVTRSADRARQLAERRSMTGGVPGPMETFLALRGLRSLSVRLERSCANAASLAQRLSDHEAVVRVRYPGLAGDPGHDRAVQQMTGGFGALISFELPDADSAERVCAATRLIAHTTSLGGIETTMERRRRHPLEDCTPDGLVRISVGCEHVDDLWRDLDRALGAA